MPVPCRCSNAPRRARFAVLLGLALVPAAAPLRAAASTPPGFLHRVLDNGLTVSVLPDSTMPICAVRVWYHVGAANEAPNSRGFAHLFEHLMFGGTHDARRRGAWEAHHHRLGGYENAYTSWDETVYESDIPPAGLDQVLVMEADRMVNLELDQENLDNEKRIVTEELRATVRERPRSTACSMAALKALCGDHPYALTPLGTKEDIAAATLDAGARDFYAALLPAEERAPRRRRPGRRRRRRSRRSSGCFGAAARRAARRRPTFPSLDGLEASASDIKLKEDLPPARSRCWSTRCRRRSRATIVALERAERAADERPGDPFREDLVRSRHQALEAGTQVLMPAPRRHPVLLLGGAPLPPRDRASSRSWTRPCATLARMDWLTDDAARRRQAHDAARGSRTSATSPATGATRSRATVVARRRDAARSTRADRVRRGHARRRRGGRTDRYVADVTTDPRLRPAREGADHAARSSAGCCRC